MTKPDRNQLTITDDRSFKQPIAKGVQFRLLEMVRMDNHAISQALLAELPMPVNLRCYLGGDVVVFNHSRRESWAADTPERAVMIALYDRIEQVMRELETGIVTPYATPGEIITACWALSMERPLPSSIGDVMEYCIYKTAKKQEWKLFEQFEHSHIPAFDRIKDNYHYLAYRIRKRVMESGRKNGYGQSWLNSRNVPNEPDVPDPYSVIATPPQPSPETQQLMQLSILNTITAPASRSPDRSSNRSHKRKSRKH